MVKHIVLFKVKPEHKNEFPALIERFKKMKGDIKELDDFEVGEDFLHSGRSYDFGLIATLKNREDLDVYANHPAHVPLKAYAASISESVVCVDFEC